MIAWMLAAGIALAGRPPAILHCGDCQPLAPARADVDPGALVDAREGTVIVPAEACVRELDFLAESEPWPDWSRKRRPARSLTVEAGEVEAFVPLPALRRGRRQPVELALVEPAHRSVTPGSADRVLDEACIAALHDAWCARGNLNGVRLVSDTWTADAAELRDPAGWGEQVEAPEGWTVERLDERTVTARPAGGHPLVLAWRTAKLAPTEADLEAIQAACPEPDKKKR